MTGLDGLAGGRNTGSGLSTVAGTAVAKGGSDSEVCPHAGDAGAFHDILSGLSRPVDPSAGSTGSAEAGDAPKSRTIPARGVSDLRAGGPRTAGSPEAPVSVFAARVACTSGRSHDGEQASIAGEHAAQSLDVHADEPVLRGWQKTDGGPEDSISVFMDRIAGRSSRSHCREPATSVADNTKQSLGVREDEAGICAEAGYGVAPSDCVTPGSADAVGDPSSATSEPVAGLDSSMAAGAAAATSICGLRPFISAPEGSGDPRAATDRSGDTSARAPMPAERTSSPRALDRSGRSAPGEPERGGNVSWPTAASGDSREPARNVAKPGFLEPIFQAGEKPPAARETVTVLAAETHFPPAAVISPINQIVQHITLELGAAIAPPDGRWMPGSATSAGEPREVAATSLRTLTILLEPANLGTMTIKLRLNGTTLGLEIEADEAETTRLVGRSRQALAEKLRALGMSVDEIVVSDAACSRRRP